MTVHDCSWVRGTALGRARVYSIYVTLLVHRGWIPDIAGNTALSLAATAVVRHLRREFHDAH